MKKYFEVALGIVTSMGGFLEVGSIATAAQAGAGYGYQLLWPILLGTICLIFLMEMAGRMAAISHHPLPAAVRERFGFNYFVIPLTAQTIVDYLVLTSEVGGMSLGLQLMTGISFQWWAAPSAIVVWLLLWKGNFNVIEYGVSFLGLLTVVFLVAALKMRPEWAAAGRGLAPSLPRHDRVHYWFLAVSILGATISPYLFNFYSSGAIEDDWDEKDLGVNRATAGLGMGFGGLISMAVLVAAAAVLHPKEIEVQTFEQIALIVSTPLGRWGYWIVAAGIFIACLGGSAGAEPGCGVRLFAMLWLGVGGEQERGGCDAVQRHILVVHSTIAHFAGIGPGSAQVDDVFDGPDGGDSAVHRAAVSGADERSTACEAAWQWLDWKQRRVFCDRDGGGAGGGCDTAGDFWRSVT